MSILMLLVLVLCFLAGSSIHYILPNLRSRWRELEGGESEQDLGQLQESFDELTARVALLEEGMEFYRRLTSSEYPTKTEPEPEA